MGRVRKVKPRSLGSLDSNAIGCIGSPRGENWKEEDEVLVESFYLERAGVNVTTEWDEGEERSNPAATSLYRLDGIEKSPLDAAIAGMNVGLASTLMEFGVHEVIGKNVYRSGRIKYHNVWR